MGYITSDNALNPMPPLILIQDYNKLLLYFVVWIIVINMGLMNKAPRLACQMFTAYFKKHVL